MNEVLNAPDPAAVEAALSRVLASPLFAQAQRQSRLLRYIVEESAAARGGRLSQFSIGVDVFDRGAEFDPTTDSGVRVEVGRLRSKLREYYETYPDDPVVFHLPKGRYVADIEMADDNRLAVSTPRSASMDQQPALVVLPFENVGGDGADEYFADGITDDLITDMSKLSTLKVIARNSAFIYKGHKPTAEQLGKELGVTHVLEGSVRRAGQRLRINAQLIDCPSGVNVWAERFDREVADVFEVQDEVGRRIVSALSIAFTANDRFGFSERGTQNLEAYDCVLRAKRLDWSQEGIENAYVLYDQSIALDTEYALPHAKMAENRWYAWRNAWIEENSIDHAVHLAERALEFDRDFGEGHSILGFIHFWLGHFDLADEHGDRAISLDPKNVRALERRAIALAYLGEFDAAEDLMQRAKSLNPHEPYFGARGVLALMRGEFEEAVPLLSGSVERFPAFNPTRECLVSVYALRGDLEGACHHLAEIQRISPELNLERTLDRWPVFETDAVARFRGGLTQAWTMYNANSN